MAGLVGYASSDEDEDVVAVPETAETTQKSASSPQAEAAVKSQPEDLGPHKSDTRLQDDSESGHTTAIGPALPTDGLPLGPSLPSADDDFPELPVIAPNDDDDDDPDRTPQSPYTANRNLIHDLTLPSVPNFDIPPSPPGSPSPAMSKKFDQFLDLKKKGVHLNAKLGDSHALKNPSLMAKLQGFVGLEGTSMYETTLGAELWDPSAFPPEVYRRQLRKSREKIAKEKETERTSGGRTSIDFVKASTTGN